jgi:hypothetical protein
METLGELVGDRIVNLEKICGDEYKEFTLKAMWNVTDNKIVV